MSATNRGAIRRESDFYKTPESATKSLVDNFFFKKGVIWEVTAGDGAIIKVLRHYLQTKEKIIATEIRDEERENLLDAGANMVLIGDFLAHPGINPEPETIITNPPFSIAREIIEHCFKIAPKAEVIMLLRLAFLESKRRKSFWDKHPVTQLYILSERPSFTGKGTDATAYAWFIWSEYRNPLIKVI